MSYRVGQVLYVVFHKENKVVPFLVTEEITKKSLKGCETTYCLQMGHNESQTFMLNAIEGEVFDSAMMAKNALIQRITSTIDKIITIAEKKAEEWYGTRRVETEAQETKAVKQQHVVEELASSDRRVRVVMPDGTVANVSIPENIDL